MLTDKLCLLVTNQNPTVAVETNISLKDFWGEFSYSIIKGKYIKGMKTGLSALYVRR